MSQPDPEQPFLPAQEEVEAIEQRREKQREEERGGAPGGVIPPFTVGSKVVMIGGPRMATTEVATDGVSKVKWKERFILFFIDTDGAFRGGLSRARSLCSLLYNGARRVDARAVKAVRRAPRTMMLLALLGGGWAASAWMRPAPVVIVQPPKEEPGFFKKLLDNIPKTREVTK